MEKLIKLIFELFTNKADTKQVSASPKEGLSVNSGSSSPEVSLAAYQEEKRGSISLLDFKTNRVKQEYAELKNKNKYMYDLLSDLSEFGYKDLVGAVRGDTIVLTMIYRTQEEQDYLYRNDPKYQKKRFKSPHQIWDAVDIRSSNYTNEQRKQIEDYLNKKYNKTNIYKWTAKYHKVQDGAYHFHIQYRRK